MVWCSKTQGEYVPRVKSCFPKSSRTVHSKGLSSVVTGAVPALLESQELRWVQSEFSWCLERVSVPRRVPTHTHELQNHVWHRQARATKVPNNLRWWRRACCGCDVVWWDCSCSSRFLHHKSISVPKPGCVTLAVVEPPCAMWCSNMWADAFGL